MENGNNMVGNSSIQVPADNKTTELVLLEKILEQGKRRNIILIICGTFSALILALIVAISVMVVPSIMEVVDELTVVSKELSGIEWQTLFDNTNELVKTSEESLNEVVSSIDGVLGTIDGVVGTIDDVVKTIDGSVSTIEGVIGTVDEVVGTMEGIKFDSLNKAIQDLQGIVAKLAAFFGG